MKGVIKTLEKEIILIETDLRTAAANGTTDDIIKFAQNLADHKHVLETLK